MKTLIVSDDFYSPVTSASSPTAYVADKLNRYGTVAGQALTYDNNGNLLTWFMGAHQQTYTYDSENRLRTANNATAQTVTYDYDPLGRRISSAVSGGATTYFLLDGDEEIAEYDSTGAVLRRYITGPAIDDRIATAQGSATVNPVKTYYHTNHQGSVIAMTDDLGRTAGCTVGTLCQRMSYDEYGNLGNGSITTGQPYRYTGRRFDSETGLYYYRARYYSPGLGRFLQVDPLGYEDDLNLYAYVGNDAVNARDPTGEWCILGVGTSCNPAPPTQEVTVTSQAPSATAPRPTAAPPESIRIPRPDIKVPPWVFSTAGIALATLGGFTALGCGDSAASPSCKGSNAVWAKKKPTTSDKSRESKPTNAPPGTKPIDQAELGREDIHKIKKGIGAGPKDYVGITPNGDVITTDPETGASQNHGPAGSYTD